jgi:PAS domain S-box-containing protein
LNTTKPKLSELESAIVRYPLVVNPYTNVIDAIAQMAIGRSQLDTDHNGDNRQAFQQEVRSSCVLVVEDDQVIGILTERDVVRLSAQQQDLDLLVMQEVMSPEIVEINLETLISNVQEILNQRSIHELVVLGDQDELLGIVTQTSFFKALSLLEMSNLAEIEEAKALISSQQIELKKRNSLLEATNEELLCTVEELSGTSEELVSQYQQLRYERFRYQNLFQIAPDGYLVTDASGKILEANQFVVDLLAIRCDFIVGKPFIVFVAPAQRELFYNKFNHVCLHNNESSASTTWEMTLTPREGNPFLAELTVTKNIDPETNGIQLCWIIRDISDRKRVEQELKQLTQFLETKVEERTQELWQVTYLQRAILNATDYAIISTDLNGIIQTFNAGAEKMLGYSASEVIGQVTPAILHEPQEAIDKAESLSVELGFDISASEVCFAKARLGLTYEDEWTYIRKDGSRFPVWVSVTALKDFNQQIVGFLGVAQNISDRKLSEAQLLLANQELLQATRLKDEFLANMSHELRTPLNAILGMTESLMEEVFGVLNQQQKNSLQIVEKSGNHLLELINDILNLAKIEAGQLTLDCAVASVN